jgi:hypothetical protein
MPYSFKFPNPVGDALRYHDQWPARADAARISALALGE